MKNIKNKNFDITGIILSTLCGIHCLLTPIVVLYLPTLGESLQSVWVHTLLIGIVGYTFYKSVITHYKLHKSKLTLGLGLSGFLILLASYFVEVFAHSHEHQEAHHPEYFMLAITILGAILLISSHIMNIKKCKCFKGEGTCSH